MAVICVRGTECTGCMDCQEEAAYRCPVCGEELAYDDKVFSTCGGDVVGCCHCIETEEAEDVL